MQNHILKLVLGEGPQGLSPIQVSRYGSAFYEARVSGWKADFNELLPIQTHIAMISANGNACYIAKKDKIIICVY